MAIGTAVFVPWWAAFLGFIFYLGIMGVLLAYRLFVLAVVLVGLGLKWVWNWVQKKRKNRHKGKHCVNKKRTA